MKDQALENILEIIEILKSDSLGETIDSLSVAHSEVLTYLLKKYIKGC